MTKRLLQHINKSTRTVKVGREYTYTDFSITLPPEHLLCAYQRRHRLYDRFLPHLSKCLEPKSTVIDVGANCGDTLAAMYDANRTLMYICIEADERFYEFLKTNVARIEEVNKSASIYLHKALVGKHITNVVLDGSGGTKHAVIGDGRINNDAGGLVSQTLDYLVSLTNPTNISLLKSDVDGFDYDVIDSAESIIRSQSPLIFFECQCDTLDQKTAYQKTIARLQAFGYCDWIVFDNFGEIIFQTHEIEHIGQLLDYVWRQSVCRSTRTIYYFDILAVSGKDAGLVRRVVETYMAV